MWLKICAALGLLTSNAVDVNVAQTFAELVVDELFVTEAAVNVAVLPSRTEVPCHARGLTSSWAIYIKVGPHKVGLRCHRFPVLSRVERPTLTR